VEIRVGPSRISPASTVDAIICYGCYVGIYIYREIKSSAWTMDSMETVFHLSTN
jgi:hypothetical protein